MSEQFTKREDYTADYTAEWARTVWEADKAKGQIHSKKSGSCLHQQHYNQYRYKKVWPKSSIFSIKADWACKSTNVFFLSCHFFQKAGISKIPSRNEALNSRRSEQRNSIAAVIVMHVREQFILWASTAAKWVSG